MALFNCSKFDLDLLKHMPCIVILTQLVVLHDGALEELGEAWDNLMDDPLGDLDIFFHIHILYFKLL